VLSEKAGDAAKAFVEYILSAEGQAVVAEHGYVAVGEAAPFAGSTVTGKIVVAGSSSVTPIMEKLSEAYKAVNPGAEIEVQQSDSTTGIKSALDGICDIGMASRALKDSELAAGLTPTVIAMDGIAVIVNLENPVGGLTSEQVRSIYTGETTSWSALNG
jgi:phosphate transport system substrate-binding protein